MKRFSGPSLVAMLGILGVAAGLGFAQQASTPYKSEEYLLLGNADRGAGEPIIFVNPKDSKNMIVVAMATLNRLPSGEAPIPASGPPSSTPDPARRDMRVKELSTPDGSLTDIAVTHDGGKTWTFTEDNLRKTLSKNRCSDSFAGAGPDGTLYMGCLAYLNRGGADYEYGYAPNGEAWYYHGGSAIESSKDQGRTWSAPVWVHRALSPQLYAPTVHPVFEQASPWDRPMFIVDDSKGTIYVPGSGPTYIVDPKTVPRPTRDPKIPGGGYTGYPPTNVTRPDVFIRSSDDDGRTWGTIYPMDDDAYPSASGGGGHGFSAAFGHFAVAYYASKVPDSGTKCPCLVFGTSEDKAKTFHRTVVPALPGTSSQPAGPPNPFRQWVMLAADPTREGRYAIARPDGRKIMVSITEDGGKTWQAATVAAELPEGATGYGHHAMKYSAKGALGLVWKATYPERRMDFWSAVSLDGAQTFRTVRISHEISPTPVSERNNFGFGDDLSSLDMDGENLYAVWGDHRSGFQGTWFGRVPLSAYSAGQ